jgi:hypothetical protein
MRAACALDAIVGCTPTPPLTAPEPVSIKSSRRRADVVQVATRELTSAGFEIATSDTTAGTLTATRKRDRRGNYDYITCDFAENSLAESNLVSTMTVIVSTSPGGNASNNVQIGASVLAAYPSLQGTPLPRSESHTDCVSTGVIEKQIARPSAARRNASRRCGEAVGGRNSLEIPVDRLRTPPDADDLPLVRA